MGLILSRFRAKTSTAEILEQMEKDIHLLETSQRRNRELQKSIVFFFLFLSTMGYMLTAAIFYMWYLPTCWSKRIYYLLPLVAFPVLVFFMKKFLHFVFVTRISKNARSLEILKKEKKKILEKVMETETYKIAKELLQKYDPNRKLVELERSVSETPKPSTPPGQELRFRVNATPAQQTPALPPPGMMRAPLSRHATPAQNVMSPLPQMPHLRMPRPNIANAPILPQNRTVFDKVAEYFVGDGPNNRYALICKQCYSHNGMALSEEFEFIAFKCCYCNMFNQARKKRMNAPRLLQSTSSDLDSGNSSSVEDTPANSSTKEKVEESDHEQVIKSEGIDNDKIENKSEDVDKK